MVIIRLPFGCLFQWQRSFDYDCEWLFHGFSTLCTVHIVCDRFASHSEKMFIFNTYIARRMSITIPHNLWRLYSSVSLKSRLGFFTSFRYLEATKTVDIIGQVLKQWNYPERDSFNNNVYLINSWLKILQQYHARLSISVYFRIAYEWIQ